MTAAPLDPVTVVGGLLLVFPCLFFVPSGARWTLAVGAVFMAMLASLFYIPYDISCRPHTAPVSSVECATFTGTTYDARRGLSFLRHETDAELADIRFANDTGRYQRPWAADGYVLALRKHSFAETCKLDRVANTAVNCFAADNVTQLDEFTRARRDAADDLYVAHVKARRRPLYYQMMEDPLILPRSLWLLMGAFIGVA